MSDITMTRRALLRGLSVLAAGAGLAACAPKAEPTAPPKPAEPTAAPKQAEATAAPKQPAATPPPAQPAGKEAILRFASWSTQQNEEVIIPGLEQFKDVVPNVKVEIEDGAAEKVTAMMVAGTAADVLLHDNNYTIYYDEGLILDVTDMYARDGLDHARDFYDGLGINKWRGRLFGVPYMFNTCIMIYNKTMVKENWGKDLWEAFPDGMWDHEDFLEVARACTKDLNGDKTIDQWGLWLTHREYYYGLETQSWTRGGDCFDLRNMKFNLTGEIPHQVNQDLLAWVRKDQLCIGDEESAELNKASNMQYPIFAGKVAMHIRMSPDVGQALRVIGDRFEWDLMYLPNYGDKLSVTRAGGHGNNINSKTAIPEEAWQFIKFYGTTPGQTFVAKTKVGVPTYRADPSLRKMYEVGNPPHDTVLLGVCEDRGGYGDHIRYHNETEGRRAYKKEMDLIYTKPYEEATKEMDAVLPRLEQELNGMLEYGDSLPFPDLEFPFKPMKK